MTENETTPRRRGRPKKVVENHQPEVTETSTVDETGLDKFDPAYEARLRAAENESMQNQVRIQMKALMAMAEKLGIDPFEGFERPPREDTLIVGNNEPAVKGRPKPGSLLGDPKDPNVAFVPWRREDLDPNEMTDFVPQPVPSLIFPLTDEEGRQKIRLDVNDLVCWLTVGVNCRVNRFFKNAYDDAYNAWRELENFKRKGPDVAPWGRVGPDGRNAWLYDPSPVSFGMDIDGRFLTPGRANAMRDVQNDNPEAI